MDDLISRKAAIEAMRECWRRVNQFAKPFEANRIMDCIKAVKELPTVDAVPEAHGQWTERHVDYASDCAIDEVQTVKCSVCGLYHTTPYLYSFTDYKFCPNCGAKMKEDT